MFNQFYFLHIPKTAGRFYKVNVIDPIENILLKNNIKVSDKDPNLNHNVWKKEYTTDTSYISSIIRDPASLMVSYYCHMFSLNEKGIILPDFDIKNINKKIFFNWIKMHIKQLSNFQAKNFLIEEIDSPNFTKSKNFADLNIDKDMLYQKLNRINFLIRSDILEENNIIKIQNKILNDLSINIKIMNFEIKSSSKLKNDISKNFYDTLNKKEIDFLYELSPIDSEIYFNYNRFWEPHDNI